LETIRIGSKCLAPLFAAEWLAMSIYIDIVCPPHLRWAWRLFILWILCGAIPLLLWADYIEKKI